MRPDATYYQHLTHSVNRITDGRNRLYYSEFNEYHSDNVFRNFSIKIPLQGSIRYQTASQEFDLQPGYFLLSYKQPGSVAIESKSPVRSLCIDIQEETVNEAFHVLSASADINLDNLQAGHFFSARFFEQVCPLDASDLSQTLRALSMRATNDRHNRPEIDESLFLQLTEKIVLAELGNHQSMQSLPATKPSTKKEVFRRLLQGKRYMDEHFLLNPCVSVISGISNLSHYHFFRSFKQAFGCPPYQYMLQKRLDHAATLVNQGLTFTDIAFECGFPDLFTFSKAFKKKFGVSPSAYTS